MSSTQLPCVYRGTINNKDIVKVEVEIMFNKKPNPITPYMQVNDRQCQKLNDYPYLDIHEMNCRDKITIATAYEVYMIGKTQVAQHKENKHKDMHIDAISQP